MGLSPLPRATPAVSPPHPVCRLGAPASLGALGTPGDTGRHPLGVGLKSPPRWALSLVTIPGLALGDAALSPCSPRGGAGVRRGDTTTGMWVLIRAGAGGRWGHRASGDIGDTRLRGRISEGLWAPGDIKLPGDIGVRGAPGSPGDTGLQGTLGTPGSGGGSLGDSGLRGTSSSPGTSGAGGHRAPRGTSGSGGHRASRATRGSRGHWGHQVLGRGNSV